MHAGKSLRKLVLLASCSLFLLSCGDDEAPKTPNKEAVNDNGSPSFQVDLAKAEITNGDLEIVSKAAQGDFRRVRTMIENKTGAVNSIDQYGVTPLIAAANQGHIDVVETLLEYIKDRKILDAGDSKGKTALYYAVEFRHPEIVELLREHGANPNIYSNEGVFPLHQAVTQGEMRIVQVLLGDIDGAIKANPDIVDSNGQTPLMLAVNSGNKEIIDALLVHGANIEKADSNGMTALMLAVESNNKEMVGYLLQNGSNINTISDNGLTALTVALKKNNSDMARHLLIKNADPNVFKADGDSPLQVAVEHESADPILIQALLAKITNPAAAISQSVLWQSIQKGNYEVVKLLLGAGADIKSLEKADSNSLLRALELQEPEMAIMLINAGADINKLDAEGYSPLALSVKNNYLEVAKLLLEKGAEIEPKTKNPAAMPLNIIIQNANAEFLDLVLGKGIKIDPNKLLIQAIVESKPALVPTIIKYGANPNVSDSLGKPVLWLAVAKSNMENVQYLIAAGAELNVRDVKKGATPLMIAVTAKNEEMVKYLLSLKADPNVLDADGLNALAYAILTEQPNMLSILAQGGADVNAKDKQGHSLAYVVENSQLNQTQRQETLDALRALGFEG